jgi:hypothetical protein
MLRKLCLKNNYKKFFNKDRFSVWRNKNGSYHRIDGPAFINTRSIAWFINGKLHRIGGPAVICSDGCNHWFQNGKLHRVDGPAIEYKDGDIHWYLAGKEFKNKEAFFEALTDEEKSIALFSEDFHNVW